MKKSYLVNVIEPTYCPYSSAYSGERICQTESFETLEKAKAFAMKIYAYDDCGELECRIYQEI